MILPYKKLSDNAITPTRGTPGSAGLDLYSAEDHAIIPNGRQLVKTNIALKIPRGYVGIIKSRSGLALRRGLDVKAGVIDSDYRGDVGVILENNNTKMEGVGKGDRVAQLLIMPVPSCYLLEESFTDETTERGENGYGSTGK